MRRAMVRTSALILSALVTIQLFPTAVLATPSIEWEVANRFRLFRSESQFRAIADIFWALPEADRQRSPALSLETGLERKAAERLLGKPFGDPASIARYGWASALLGQ